MGPRLGWHIRHECPQCGAPVVLKETDRILTCHFCRTRLNLVARDLFRYYLPYANPGESKMLFFPYHRLRGSVFTLTQDGIKARYIDVNARMLDIPALPATLGIRPQAMTLSFVRPDMQGSFATPLASSSFWKRWVSPAEKLIGETESLIYFPTYIEKSSLYDAILKRVLGPWPDEIEFTTAPCPPESITYVASICPNCGGDLEGEGDAVVLICSNCETAWRCEKNNLVPVTFGVWAISDDSTRYLPFWHLHVCLSGLPGDALMAPFSLSEGVFSVPAFKLNPVHLLRWSRQVTTFRPRMELSRKLKGRILHPATMAIEEALEIVPVILAEMAWNKKAFGEIWSDVSVKLEEAYLVYHPFTEQGGELVHSIMGLAMNRNSLRFGLSL